MPKTTFNRLFCEYDTRVTLVAPKEKDYYKALSLRKIHDHYPKLANIYEAIQRAEYGDRRVTEGVRILEALDEELGQLREDGQRVLFTGVEPLGEAVHSHKKKYE